MSGYVTTYYKRSWLRPKLDSAGWHDGIGRGYGRLWIMVTDPDRSVIALVSNPTWIESILRLRRFLSRLL